MMATKMDEDFAEEWYEKIVEKKVNTLSDLVESLSEEILSIDIQERVHGLDKIFSVVKRFDKNFLTEGEVGLLLEFFIAKINDFALEKSCAIEGTRYVLYNNENIPKNCEKEIFQGIFKDANVQSWRVSDRGYLFDIFSFLIQTEERINNLKVLESDVVLAFVTAATGEKDPRLLMKVFKIFLQVVKYFSLGHFVEDMFDVVACYYPVEYTPPDNDTFNITREMLSVACEKCLLSTKSFTSYCHTLIQDRLTESDEDNPLEGKLYDCLFLKKAIGAFGIAGSAPYVKDYFTAFRGIILNPTLKKCQHSIPQEIREVVQFIIGELLNEKERGRSLIKTIIDELLENAEPFIVQAEMGLCARTLDFVYSAYEVLKDEEIKKKALYWIGILLEGKTLQSKENHKEIIEESLPFSRKFLSLSTTFGKEVDTLLKQLEDLEEKFGDIVFEYECCIESLLLKNGSERCYKKFLHSGIENIVQKEYNIDHSFFKLCHEISQKYPQLLVDELSKQDEAFITNPYVLNIFTSALIDQNTWNRMEKFIFKSINANGFNDKVSEILIHFSKTVDSLILEEFIYMIIKKYNELVIHDNIHHSRVVAEVGLHLNEKEHNEIVTTCLAIVEGNSDNELGEVVFKTKEDIQNLLYIVFPLLVQSKILTYSDVNIIALSLNRDFEKRIIYGAYISHSSDPKSIDVLEDDKDMEDLETRVHLIKILSLKNHPDYLKYIHDIFDDINKERIQETDHEIVIKLFDFEGLYNDPILCNYSHSILWRQRYFCKFVEIFMEHYLFTVTYSLYFALLQPMLSFAATISIPMNVELLSLLPVIVDALMQVTEIKTETDHHAVLSLLNGLNQLLPMAPLAEVEQKTIDNVIIKLLDFIQDTSKPLITLQSLVVLETLTKVSVPERIVIFYTRVVNALSVASKCPKRAIRIAGAKVRNQWEILL
uniref:MMS19 nucleotide excision repair protein n=1 Tax=Strongyloides venezuelensis TaxID=75913 RepID=A0A0K0FGU4_STRVS